MNTNFTQKDLMAFSPVDMQIYMGGKVLRSVLQLQYAVEREVVALYGFGDANPVGFNRGKRGIVGSLVCNTFQDHPLLRGNWAQDTGIYNGEGSAFNTLENAFDTTNDAFKSTFDDYAFQNGTFKLNTAPQFGGGTFPLADSSLQDELDASYNWVKNRKFNYVDQLPPMDIVVTCVNEMGAAAYLAINSCIIIGESGMMSMESLTSETHFKFLARSITPLRSFNASKKNESSPAGFSDIGVGGSPSRTRGNDIVTGF